MEMDDKDLEGQFKLKGLWNDSKRYQQTREEVRNALSKSKEMPHIVPFYKQRYFAVAASIIILIGISVLLILIVHKPFSDSGNDNLTHGNDTTLKLYMDKPDAKARQQIYRDEILLQWTRVYDTITHLVILNATENEIVYRATIKPSQQSFRLPKNTLKPGKYHWYIGDKKQKNTLIIDH